MKAKELYNAHIEAQANLKYWKDKEAELRTKICADLLEGRPVGTHSITKGDYKLKVTKKINYKLDKDVLSAIWDDLSEDEQDSIKMEPKLLIKEYKSIDDHQTLDHAITVVPAMPTLSIEYVVE